MNTYNKRKLEDEKKIIPEGGSVRVSMLAMDATQRQIANQPAMDERVAHNLAANRDTLAAGIRDADRAKAHADHYSAQMAAHIDHSVYGDYTRQLSNAWKQVPA